MIKSTYIFLTAALLTGCGGSNIRVIGLNQQTAECPAGQSAYFYEQQKVGVCIDAHHASFMACMRQLGVEEEAAKVASEAAGSVKGSYAGAGVDVSGSSKDNKEVTIKMVSSGPIAEARAQALRACADAFRMKVGVPEARPDRPDAAGQQVGGAPTEVK